MNVDSYFKIGHTHSCCEDYALVGSYADVVYAIVSDGCSSSSFVDFGARLISFSAKLSVDAGLFSLGYFELGDLIIKQASRAAQVLFLHPDILNATLLLAIWDSKQLRICVWGDGAVVLRHNNGKELIIHVNYQSGAPYYLSYRLNHRNKEEYHKNANVPVFLTINDTVKETTIDEKVEFIYLPDEWSQVSLLSDGINTFSQPGQDIMSYKEIIPELTNYKNTAGVFVQRRMKFFEKKCLAEQIIHDDDIAVATIVNQ